MGSTASSTTNSKINPVGSLTAEEVNALKLDEEDGAPDEIVPHRMSALGNQQLRDSLESLQARAEWISDIHYADYEYPFENLVFEGGGAKGQVYIGCLQVLEEIGLKPKRVAGASAGAICAALLAAGFSVSELDEILQSDLEKVLIDHSCGICSLLPNLIMNFGWNPGNRFMQVFGDLLVTKFKGKFGADITFLELYKETKVELCVTAVCVNRLSVEYFHHKTTPNTAVRLAVRMSLSIPGIFEAVKVVNSRKQTDFYIDGGLLCNYPIHAFDGWWLSSKKGDSFLSRVKSLNNLHQLMEKKERFGEYNEKTLGFLVYSSLEQDLLQQDLNKRVGVTEIERPAASKLYQSRAEALDLKQKTLQKDQVVLNALDKFMKMGSKVTGQQSEEDVDDIIDINELKQVFREAMENEYQPRDEPDSHHDDCEDEKFTKAHVEILFGENTDIDKVFDRLDANDNGGISFSELLLFIERSGIDIQSKFQGYDRHELVTLGQFVIGLQDCLLTNVKKMYLGVDDIHRTVGINTDYIGTMDFKMEDVDRQFCIKQGRNATISYLKHYVDQKKPKKKYLTKAPLPNIPTASLANGGRMLPSSSGISPSRLADSMPPSQSSMDTKETTLMHNSLPPIRGKAVDVTDNPRLLPRLLPPIRTKDPILTPAQVHSKSSNVTGVTGATAVNDRERRETGYTSSSGSSTDEV